MAKTIKRNRKYTAEEAVDILAMYHAARRLLIAKKDRRWKLAQAAATDKHLLIGSCHIFKNPSR